MTTMFMTTDVSCYQFTNVKCINANVYQYEMHQCEIVNTSNETSLDKVAKLVADHTPANVTSDSDLTR